MIGREQLARLWSNLLALGARRLAALAVIGLGVFAAVGLGSYYLSRPDYETLYVGLNAQDVSRIGAALKEAGIAFDVGSDGTKVLVRNGQTAQARMLLAEKGLPSSANSGYELFDKLGPMGLTSFMQEVTRVRALEGEIARTIQAMKGVKAARVHIVLPDSGSFRRTPQPPSASVVIRTEWAGDTSSAQAIRHLVAAAVPGLNVDQVTVLNTDGTVMAAAGDLEGAAPGRMAALEKGVSKELQHNVRKTLAPYLGLDNFEVSVAARINTDKRQINETEYNPETKVERSVRVVKETGSSQNVNSRAAASVEQNLPADQPSTRSGDQSSRQNERREELTNYEMNTKTISTLSDGYKIENLTIAVVVNRKRLLASLGKDAGQEAIDRQLKELEALVGSAAGVDSKRGDRVTIAAVDFFRNEQPMEPVPSPGILELLLGHLGSLLNAGAIVIATLILIWFGLRPTVRAILEQPAPKAIAGGGLAVEKSGAAQSIAGPRPIGEPEPNLIADLTSRLGRTPQKRLEQMVDLDEDQAAAILKQWVRGAGRA
ncbi:MAG TPA: flagellar basal-body MS-ring/collar protein FliF [Hyphomicrobiaceae bacterium]|nr:flagellar basal-body MS-ring/collar protein FliF [Hyphomicrobiaceae bacterium]